MQHEPPPGVTPPPVADPFGRPGVSCVRSYAAITPGEMGRRTSPPATPPPAIPPVAPDSTGIFTLQLPVSQVMFEWSQQRGRWRVIGVPDHRSGVAVSPAWRPIADRRGIYAFAGRCDDDPSKLWQVIAWAAVHVTTIAVSHPSGGDLPTVAVGPMLVGEFVVDLPERVPDWASKISINKGF